MYKGLLHFNRPGLKGFDRPRGIYKGREDFEEGGSSLPRLGGDEGRDHVLGDVSKRVTRLGRASGQSLIGFPLVVDPLSWLV